MPPPRRSRALRHTVFGLLIFCSRAWADPVVVLESGPQLSLAPWSEKAFEGQTQYRPTSIDGETVLCSDSQASASALYLEKAIDLDRTPWLQWRWRVVQALPAGEERSRAGDDFAARIYVLHSSGFWKFGLRALNYVISRNAVAGEIWPNPFAGKRAMMLSLGPQDSGLWQWEQRNVREDFAHILDRDIQHIDGIAIMSDSDNSGTSTAACFADIRFSENPWDTPPALSSLRHRSRE